MSKSLTSGTRSAIAARRRTPTVDILMVGPYPPPIGGVSVHVSRLVDAIKNQGLSVSVLNHFRGVADPLVAADLRRNPLRYWLELRRFKGRLVHYHHSHWLALIATSLALSGRDKPASLISVHSQVICRSLTRRRSLINLLTRRMLESFDGVVAVSPEIAQTLQRALPGREILVIPAYLPLQPNQPGAEPSTATKAFLERGHPTLLAAAYRLTAERSGRTTYGFDFALELFMSLAEDHPEMLLALFLAQRPRNRHEHRRLGDLRRRAVAARIESRLRICIGEPLPLAFSYNCVFLRPTTTDGDAVSVREALAAGVPVIASDVVSRPVGAVVLPLRRQAWIDAVRHALDRSTRRTPSDAVPDPSEGLMTVYQSLLSR